MKAKKQKATKKHITKRARTPEPASPVPMKVYAEPAPAPTAPAPVPATAFNPGPVVTQGTQPQYAPQPSYRAPYQQPQGQGQQGEFTRITSLFPSSTKMGSSSAVLKDQQVAAFKQVAQLVKPGDKLGISVDRNGRPYLWYLRR